MTLWVLFLWSDFDRWPHGDLLQVRGKKTEVHAESVLKGCTFIGYKYSKQINRTKISVVGVKAPLSQFRYMYNISAL